MSQTWWEKTVEYGFVALLIKKKIIDFAAPVSGKHERSSADGIFGKDSKLVLIEFKRDVGEIMSERSMFTDYDAAQRILSNYNHHWIVYGLINDNKKFAIRGRKYFGDATEVGVLDIPPKGIGHSEFMEYLKILNQFKYPDGRGDGGHVGPESMATVLGISPDGKVVGSSTLYEYAPKLFAAPTPPAAPSAPATSFRPGGMS
ncbi:hypothetical protein ACVW0Y_002684 [Pseudomonas sp. TE3786]